MTQGILLFDSLVAVIALLVGFFLHKFVVDRRRSDAQQTARRIVEAAGMLPTTIVSPSGVI